MTLSNNAEDQVLDAIVNAETTGFPAADPWIQLHSGDPGEAGTTNVVSVARVQAAFNAASGGTTANTANIDFPSMPAVGPLPAGVMGWSIWDVTDPTPGDGSPLGACFWTGWFSIVSGTAQVDDEDLAGNLIESPTHGLINDDRVVFEALEGFTVPTGITPGTVYFVLAATDDDITISATQDGSVIDVTGEGQCIWRKVTPKAVDSLDTFRIPAGDLDLFID